jgi:hypothetical protein
MNLSVVVGSVPGILLRLALDHETEVTRKFGLQIEDKYAFWPIRWLIPA